MRSREVAMQKTHEFDPIFELKKEGRKGATLILIPDDDG